MVNIKLYEDFLNEDWGSSDQTAMNNSMHKELGEPKEPPMLNDVFTAAESAVDFYWEDWAEYKTDKDSLIKKAAKYYYQAKFPEFMKMMKLMMTPK